MTAAALLAAVRARTRRLARRDATTCRCTHSHSAHTHNRPGHDCGACGPQACSRFRAQPRSAAELAVAVLVEQAWQHTSRGDGVGAERVIASIAELGPDTMWRLLTHCAEAIVDANKTAAGWAPHERPVAVVRQYEQYGGDLVMFEQLIEAQMWAAEFLRFYITGHAAQERALFELLDPMDQHERAAALLRMAVRTVAALADTGRRG